MSNNHKQSAPAKFQLNIGTRAISLALGSVLKGDAIGLGGHDTLIARVDPHPNHADELVLLNLSDRTWSVRAATGEQRDIASKKAVKVEGGRRIDFGGITGVIESVAGEPTWLDTLVPIDKNELAFLSRKLDRAAIEGKLSRAQFDPLHAAFFARDKTGTAWTIGLRTKQWNRAKAGKWSAGEAPEQLFIDPKTLKQLKALVQPAS